MPIDLVLHKGDSPSLDGVCNNDRGATTDRLSLSTRRSNLRDIVAINLEYRPVPGSENGSGVGNGEHGLPGLGFRRLCPAILLQLVVVDNRSQIVNTESGGMGKSHRGKIDIAFDVSTNNPGVHIFEKMISGAYLGPLFLFTIRQAVTDGLLLSPVADAVGQITELTTKDMNDFMFSSDGDNPLAIACKNGDDNDAKLLYAIAERLVERAAKLTAVNLSAMAIKSGKGTDPSLPTCVIADGTTFYHMKTLKPRVQFYLKQYLEDQRGIYTEIINIENAPIIGAAIAGLTN